MRSSKGITLIALVITIIVLIILAGVAINLTLGENGILRKSEEAKLKYEIAQAEEELDLKIVDLQAEKQGTATLQDLVDMLKAEEDMDYIVSLEEIATITGVEEIGDVEEIYVVYKIYQFRVDDRLQTEFISIVENYTADVQISSTLKSYDGKNEDEKYLATFEIKVESEGQVQSIEIETIDGKVTETPTSLPYTKEIQVEIGQKYIVKVTTPDGKYKRYVIEEKAEETIKTAQELATFRDKVNSGLTYEGKTVTIAADNIDLSSVCGANINGKEVSWEPIGSAATSFKGTFDGNYNKIKNLYINEEKSNQGLFGLNYGIIKQLYVVNGSVSAINNVGGIVGKNYGIVEKCGVDVDILNNYASATGIGGIVGYNYGEIKYCFNLGDISNTGSDSHSVGGIAGCNRTGGTIIGCYNTGRITGVSRTGGIAGQNTDDSKTKNVFITDCYNAGTITASTTTYIGAVAGSNGISSTYPGGTIGNCYYLQETYSKGVSTSSGHTKTEATVKTDAELKSTDIIALLGDSFTADVKIKVKNEETGLEEEVWSNGGYPILKWQIGE